MRLILFLFVLTLPMIIHAGNSSLLTLEALLDSVDQHYPLVKKDQEKITQAQADVLVAEAAFDFGLQVRAGRQSTGYPINQSLQGNLTHQILNTGIIAALTWDQFDGSVPNYRGDQLTGSDGRITGSLRIPLLRNLLTDESRTKLEISKIARQMSFQNLRMTQMKTYIEASDAYYLWLSNVQRRKVSERLLKLAEQKNDFIQRRVEVGDLPKVDLIELEKIILERQMAVLEDQQKEFMSAQTLSLYYRDEVGMTLIPDSNKAADLSSEWQSAAEVSLVNLNIEQFPLIEKLNLEIQDSQESIQLTKQSRLPTLDLILEESQYRGNLPSNRMDPRESYFGLAFSFPLLNKEAKGNYRKAQSKLEEQKQELIFVRDQLQAKLKNLQNNLEIMIKIHKNNLKQISNSEALSTVARRKYEKGAEDLFIVNSREVEEANAYRNSIQSYIQYQKTKNELLILQNQWIRKY